MHTISKELKPKETHQQNNIVTNLRGVSTPTPVVAWISGSFGCILKTINYGYDWETLQIPNTEKYEFRDIKGFSEHTAYVMSSGEGALSTIYKTTDGGKSWELQLKGKGSEFFNAMSFWNKDCGIVLSDPIDGKFHLYTTENGGKDWLPIPKDNMPNALQNEGAFAASGSSITTYGELDAWFGTGGNAARVFHTHDGGKSWLVTNTPLMQDSPSSGIFSIAFCDSMNGVIAGGCHKNPENGGANLALTKNGGLSWELSAISPQYYWSQVSYSKNRNHILLVGNQHIGLTNSQNPNNWEKSSVTKGFNAFSFWSKDTVLAVGEEGKIVEFEIPTL